MASQPLPMSAHRLNLSKGWPSQSALDATHKISANVLYDLQPGQVCHQNSVGELEPGCVAWQMPFFIFGGAASLDTMNTPGINWWPITPKGKVACFPGKAPMLMWTTEFDQTQTYAPNQPLRAPVGNGATDYAAGSGQLTNQGVLTVVDTIASGAVKYTAVVGLAIMPSNFPVAFNAAAPTTPVCTNVDGNKCLSFYPIYFPGHPTQTA